MERVKRNNKRVVKLLVVINVLLFCIGCAYYYLYKLRRNEIEKNISELQKDGVSLYESIEAFQEEIQKLASQLDEFENFDTAVKKEKSAFSKELAVLEEKILNGESDKKIAYLTFDDGPYYLTEQFLDVLDNYGVKGTFFCLRKDASRGFEDEEEFYDSIYRRIIESGHTLGNHTATHKLGSEGVYQSVDYFMEDLLNNRRFIFDRYGYTTTIMRFPGGSGTSSKAPEIMTRLENENYCFVDWNVETGDGMRVLDSYTSAYNVLNNTEGKPILVVLMHDYSKGTLGALPDIIEGLKEQGYIFLPIVNSSSVCK